MTAQGNPAVEAINVFTDDPWEELKNVQEGAIAAGAVRAAVTTHWAEGGKGAKNSHRRWSQLAIKRPSITRFSRIRLPSRTRSKPGDECTRPMA